MQSSNQRSWSVASNATSSNFSETINGAITLVLAISLYPCLLETLLTGWVSTIHTYTLKLYSDYFHAYKLAVCRNHKWTDGQYCQAHILKTQQYWSVHSTVWCGLITYHPAYMSPRYSFICHCHIMYMYMYCIWTCIIKLLSQAATMRKV